MSAVPPLELATIEHAAGVIGPHIVRTPLVPLELSDGRPVHLKLENLQPIGSFKLRRALNAVEALGARAERGVVTASAGNVAQGVAWAARRAQAPCTVVMPDGAPETKRRAVERLGGRVVQVEFELWWRAIEEARFEELGGEFVHPVQDRAVMAGNGTIGLEIVDDLPGVDAVLVPYGGGGLATGIASAVKHRSPDTEVLAVEPETAAASSCALAAGGPADVPFERSFVDGASTILPIMWPLASAVLDGAITLAVAAATAARGEEWESLVAVVSGGNIDASVLATILGGETP